MGEKAKNSKLISKLKTMKEVYYSGSTYYLRATYILRVSEYIRSAPYTSNYYDIATEHNNNDGTKLSGNSTRKLRQSIEWLVRSCGTKTYVTGNNSKGITNKCVFITLTYSSKERQVSDKFIKQVLMKNWVKRMRYQVGNFNYVWRIEKHKNGNTHIHITGNRYMHWRIIRQEWNEVLYRNGLMHHYLATHGTIDANSTDVHSVRKVKNLGAYLSKYMSKENGRKGNTGRLWGCSAAIAKARNLKVFISVDDESKIADTLRRLKNKWLESNGWEIGQLFLFDTIRQLPQFLKSEYKQAIWKLNNYYTLFDELQST